MADDKPEITEEQTKLRLQGFHAKRAKHQFAFETDDENYPYGMQTNGVGKKVAIFNYSSEYFRKKKSSNIGLNSIAGGNIPSDMDDKITIVNEGANADGSTPPPLVCNLNKGNGTRLQAINTLNLSPNKIQPVPCQCTLNPEWTANNCDNKLEGGKCYKYTAPVPGTNSSPIKVEIPKTVPADCPETDIIPERGKDHKPNFMYLPSYQCSCSEHPRAEGFANEDNYDCLKKSKLGSENGICCDYFGLCMISFLHAFHIDLVDNPYFIEKGGKPGQKLNIDGKDIPEKIKKFIPDCNVAFAGTTSDLGFSCNDQLNPYHEITAMDKVGLLKTVCDSSDVCSFGWHIPITPPTSLCPERPSIDSIPADIISKYGKDVVNQFSQYGGHFFRLYLANGNTDCGCTGKGYVQYNGYKDSKRCDYGFFPVKNGIPDTPIGINEWHYEVHPSSPKTVCGCIWTDEIEIKGKGYNDKMYVSTLSYPSYKFNNGTKLEISDTGAIRELGCAGEFQMNCNDVN